MNLNQRAFPGHDESNPGMSLRDYFATGAMQTALQGATMPTKADRDKFLPMIAEVAYEMADAMLKERNK